MAKNRDLIKAKEQKKDEFYTQLTDIEKEMKHYTAHFRGKTIFLNCDDPEYSNFWMYFQLNFYQLGLKKLISTHYEESNPSYKMEIVSTNRDDGQAGTQLGMPSAISQRLDALPMRFTKTILVGQRLDRTIWKLLLAGSQARKGKLLRSTWLSINMTKMPMRSGFMFKV